MNKELTLIGLSLKGSGIYMYMDNELPENTEAYYRIMEQFDIKEAQAKQIINKFKDLSLDIERIVGF